MKARRAYRRCILLNRKQSELPLLMYESIRKKKELKIAHYSRKLADPERQNLPHNRKVKIQ